MESFSFYLPLMMPIKLFENSLKKNYSRWSLFEGFEVTIVVIGNKSLHSVREPLEELYQVTQTGGQL